MSATQANETLPSLAQLSPELLHRIASLGTCSSALNLRLVCRAFHRICDSRILYQEIIHNGNGLSVPDPSSSSSPRWVYSDLVLSLHQPAHVWARYALADEKARELSRRRVHAVSPTGLVGVSRREQVLPRRLESWMPQLCALHYPEVELDTTVPAMVTSLLAPVQALSFSPEEMALSFVFASYLLTSSVDPYVRRHMLDFARNALNEGAGGKVSRSEIEGTSWNRLREKMFGVQQTNSNRESGLARLVVGFMAIDIRFGTYKNIYLWNKSIIPISPPALDQIPFAELMANIPLPFEPAAERFNVCHLEKMASKAFLEAGEWVGYYCSSSEAAWSYLDPPMRGIFFQVEDEYQGGLVRLRAGGFDAVGSFTLTGTLHPGTGDVTMIKQYLGAHMWMWRGSLTPFGIAGSWGGHNAWFWLWKADWCQ
ncbi:hypothetical protein MMC17_008773 [Xylographa soralifera]|nr:hypothetical protein [Xylographa soralifera]